jgi:hypothetical protein
MAAPGRDNKGRFTKGNTEGKNSPIRNGLATEMQALSVAKRIENRTLRETVLYVLREKEKSGLTKQERIVREALEGSDRGISIKDLRDLAEILGESKLNITLEQDSDTRPEIEID